MSEKYAAFYGQINEKSAQTLIQHLSAAARTAEAVHLLLHSMGGIAFEGIGLYSYLRSYPIPISIYNMSCLQSAGSAAYLGANRRIVGEAAKFMFHGSYIQGSMALQQGAEFLKEHLAGLVKIDESLDQILKRHLKNWAGLNGREHWFDAQAAVECGLATSIGHFSPPKGDWVENFF